jgi:hypothetical protein
MYKYPKRKIKNWLRYYFAKLPTTTKFFLDLKETLLSLPYENNLYHVRVVSILTSEAKFIHEINISSVQGNP